MALLFTWRALSRMRNSVSTNLLMLDEIFDGSLDVDGVESLRVLFEEVDQTNIFVISHKEQFSGHFQETLYFEKKQNFSVIRRDMV
mgnify:CR=1 FL=1